MKLLCGCCGWLVWCCCLAGDPTNTVDSLFSCPPLQLRQLTEAAEPASAFAPSAFQLQSTAVPPELERSVVAEREETLLEMEPNDSAADVFELDTLSTASSRRIYRRLDEEGFFVRPSVGSDNLIDRAIDSIFVPEPVQFGNVTASCSIYTAIQRRNPLCLINPIFFNLSW